MVVPGRDRIWVRGVLLDKSVRVEGLDNERESKCGR